MRPKGRSATGRARRQAILDYLNSVKVPTDGGTLLAATGETDRRTMMARLKRMAEQDEVTVTTKLHNSYYVNFYTANAEFTKDRYPPSRWNRKEGVEYAEDELAPERRKHSKPGHIVHYCDDSKPPLRDQRGQGCAYPVSRGFSIMSTLG